MNGTSDDAQTPRFGHQAEQQEVRTARITGFAKLSTSLLWAVDATGCVFSVDAMGAVESYPLPGGWRAETVAASGMGSLWVTGALGRRHALWVRSRAVTKWAWRADLLGSSVLAGSTSGGVWYLGGDHLIWLNDEGETHRRHLDFSPRHISEGADGTLWAIGGKARFGGKSVYRYDGNREQWFVLPPPAAAVKISGAPDGMAWTVNSKGDLWRLHPNGAGNFKECSMVADCRNCLYSPHATSIRDASVGLDGNVWVLSDDVTLNGYAIGWLADYSSRKFSFLASEHGATSIAASVKQ